VILYLHGFRSAPASHKARALAARMSERGCGDQFVCPQLPASPAAASARAEDIIAKAGDKVTIIGSSLGGFYATYLAEQHQAKAVLVNPAVVAHLSLAELVGTHTNLYSGETFEFTARHIDELRGLDVATITRPEHYWLLVECGDEVLDYRLAIAKYPGAAQTVLPDGDHSFTRWTAYLDRIIAFAGL
jgi:predicted esterase YcpF (UPF0227 family)